MVSIKSVECGERHGVFLEGKASIDELALTLARTYLSHLHDLGEGSAAVVVTDGDTDSRIIRVRDDNDSSYQTYKLQGTFRQVVPHTQSDSFGFCEYGLMEGIERVENTSGNREMFIPYLRRFIGQNLQAICADQIVFRSPSIVCGEYPVDVNGNKLQ